MPASERGSIGSVARLTVAVLATASLVAFCKSGGPERAPDTALSPVPAEASTFAADLAGTGVALPQTFTYYFYWYDAETGLHMGPRDPLPTKPVPEPVTSYRSVDWHQRQLADMNEALIDVVLPVYWGEDPAEPWSSLGLTVLVEARSRLLSSGQPAPSIGMFYDTTILRGVDLTTDAGMVAFYGHVKNFYHRIPDEHRAKVDGRPVVWLFLPQDNKYDQRVFDHTVTKFTEDFGVRPFVVRATGWHGVKTDASYVWGAAQNGVQATDLVASVGPGYDERKVPGRGGAHRPRQGGLWYRSNLETALLSGRPLVAVETWNEFHEASGIGETVEYGRAYIEITRDLVAASRARAR